MIAAKRIPAKFKVPGTKPLRPHFITKNKQPVMYNPANPNQTGKYYWNPLLSEAERKQGIRAHEVDVPEYAPPDYERTFPTVDRFDKIPAKIIPPIVLPAHQPSTTEDVVMKEENLVSYPSLFDTKPIPPPIQIYPYQQVSSPDPSPFGVAAQNSPMIIDVNVSEIKPPSPKLSSPVSAKQDVIMVDPTFTGPDVQMLDPTYVGEEDVQMIDLSSDFSNMIALRPTNSHVVPFTSSSSNIVALKPSSNGAVTSYKPNKPTSNAVSHRIKPNKPQRPEPYIKPQKPDKPTAPSSSNKPQKPGKSRYNLIKIAAKLKNSADRPGTHAEGVQARRVYEKHIKKHKITSEEIADFIARENFRRGRKN
jgi:hypothetical protein